MDHYEKELIARGPTFADDDTTTGRVHWAAGPAEARATFDPARHAHIEVHNWEFGGRR